MPKRPLKPAKDCLSWSIFITQLLKQWPERPKMNDKVKKSKKAKKAKRPKGQKGQKGQKAKKAKNDR